MGRHMEKELLSLIINFLSEICKDEFSGIRGKLRLLHLKKKLTRDIHNSILIIYGNKDYYNEFDHFIVEHDVICSIIRNSSSYSPLTYRSRTESINYYVSLFFNEHPQFQCHHNEIREILFQYYTIIFDELNQINSEPARSICAIINQINGELTCQLKDIRDLLSSINDKTVIPNPISGQENVFIKNKYTNYVISLYQHPQYTSYIPRKFININNKNEECDLLSALLRDRKILLLNEAGYGKTYECIRLLNNTLDDSNIKHYVPFYFPLSEYGVLYSDILSGIKYKIGSFFEGNLDMLTTNLLNSEQVLFIFDGIDEIPEDRYRTKFSLEINDYSARYINALFIVTSRINNYNNELSSFISYSLSPVDETTIRSILKNEGIIEKLPDRYYELFSNPYLLEIGKALLKNNAHGALANRSILFDELFHQLYEEGRHKSIHLTCSEAAKLLGKIAYEDFSLPQYSYMQFDQRISNLVDTNKKEIIDSFISSGLLICRPTGISFAHNLIKEYLVANYLISIYPFEQNKEFYIRLINKTEWYEVFVFICGLVKSNEEQNSLLNLIIENNLQLYVKCIYDKDSISLDGIYEKQSAGYTFLQNIVESYYYIISHYFAPLADLFTPINSSYMDKYKIGIFGTITENCQILFWLDLVPIDGPSVICFDKTQFESYRNESRERAYNQNRWIEYHQVSLNNKKNPSQEGRATAINMIKSELDQIIEGKKLIESNYLLCERITCTKYKYKELRETNDLFEMRNIINNIISQRKTQFAIPPSKFEQLNSELLFLKSIINHMINERVLYSENILPGPDVSTEDIKIGWMWELYSKEQTIKRISYTLYWHELSYRYMIEKNFPLLKDYFSQFNDYPYQPIVTIDFNENVDPKDMMSCPIVSYYNVAVNSDDETIPLVTEGNCKDTYEDIQKKIQIIQDSYTFLGRKSCKSRIVSTNITSFLLDVRSGSKDPLSSLVYDSIKKSLEEVLGRFN